MKSQPFTQPCCNRCVNLLPFQRTWLCAGRPLSRPCCRADRHLSATQATPSTETEMVFSTLGPVPTPPTAPTPGGGWICWILTQSPLSPSPTEETAVLTGSAEPRSALAAPWITTASVTHSQYRSLQHTLIFTSTPKI